MYITREWKFQIVAGLLLLVAVSGLVPSAAAQGDKLGLLRIVAADYPAQVPLSYSFSVKLKVEYAFREYYEIQAAVYEGPRGMLDHPLWEGQPERLIEVGQRSYDVKLRSPSREGTWLLTGYVFHRNESGKFYFTDEERGPGFVEMEIKLADDVRLTVRTPYGNVPVEVDGSSYLTDATGVLVRDVRVLAEHRITAPENVTVAEGWRAFFVSWNGTDHTNPRRILVAIDLVLTIEFRDEFYLDVGSSVAGVRGAGWYPSGSVASISAPLVAQSQDWTSVFGAQWRFAGWTGDVVSYAPNESIVMDRPHRVSANWTADYERISYLIVAIAVAATVVVLAVLFRRRTSRKGVEETAETAETAVTGEAAETTELAEAPAGRFCIFCGADIDPDARFCSKCGRSLVSSD